MDLECNVHYITPESWELVNSSYVDSLFSEGDISWIRDEYKRILRIILDYDKLLDDELSTDLFIQSSINTLKQNIHLIEYIWKRCKEQWITIPNTYEKKSTI